MKNKIKSIACFAFLTTVLSINSFLATNSGIVHAQDKNAVIFSDLREKWKVRLVGNVMNQEEEKIVKPTVSSSDKVTARLIQTMNVDPKASLLWNDLANYPESEQMRRSYDNILRMAISYQTTQSKYYHQKELKEKILFGLDSLYTQKYNETKKEVGNWWDWEVGAPADLEETAILMYDDLSKEKVKKYMNVVHKFTPDSKYFTFLNKPGKLAPLTPANVLYKAKVVILHGILTENANEIEEAKKDIDNVLVYSETGNGFYKDGSFIEHNKFAYNGGYGGVMFGTSVQMMALFDGTRFAFSPEKKQILTNWANDSFIPFIYKGELMDMVRGRSIYSDGEMGARTYILSILELSEYVPEPTASYFRSKVKEWNRNTTSASTKNPPYNYNFPYDSVYNVLLQEKLYNKSVAGNNNKTNEQLSSFRNKTSKQLNFPTMDRVLHQEKDYIFGISMSSSRIANYESIGQQNLKGWNTGSGMTYLYNGDGSQYTDTYFSTIDKTRLPGTTTEHETLPDGFEQGYVNQKDWVGSSQVDNLYGTAGMDIQPFSTSRLTGKKSWFMFDDEIVALGAGIDNSASLKTTNVPSVETTIENRKVGNPQKTTITSNEGNLNTKNGEEQNAKLNWVQIEDSVSHSKVGYYFPDSKSISFKQETREGSVQENYSYGSSKEVQGSFFTMWFNHGTKPKNDSYSYVLLPNKSVAEVGEYAKNPDIKILRNDSTVQSVKDEKLGVIGVNFWDKGSVEGFSSQQPASLTAKDSAGVLTVGVSDPTQKQNSITIEIDKVGTGTIQTDSSIKVKRLYPTILLEVDTTNKKGATQSITLTYDPSYSVKKVFPTADTYIRDGTYQQDNYGDNTQMVVKHAIKNYNRISYMRFNLLPEDITGVAYASINMNSIRNTESLDPVKVSVYNANQIWDEHQVTWNNKIGYKDELDSVIVTAPAGYREWNVTRYLQTLPKQHSIASFAFTGQLNGPGVIFNTKESNMKPYLLIVTKK